MDMIDTPYEYVFVPYVMNSEWYKKHGDQWTVGRIEVRNEQMSPYSIKEYTAIFDSNQMQQEICQYGLSQDFIEYVFNLNSKREMTIDQIIKEYRDDTGSEVRIYNMAEFNEVQNFS